MGQQDINEMKEYYSKDIEFRIMDIARGLKVVQLQEFLNTRSRGEGSRSSNSEESLLKKLKGENRFKKNKIISFRKGTLEDKIRKNQDGDKKRGPTKMARSIN